MLAKIHPMGLLEQLTRRSDRRRTMGGFRGSFFIDGRGVTLSERARRGRQGVLRLSGPRSFDLCIKVPFYPSEYDCYSFMVTSVRETRGLVRPCAGLLYRRVGQATSVTGGLNLELRAMCFNNNAPAALDTRRLSAILKAMGGDFSVSADHRFAIRTNHPSAVSVTGLFTLGRGGISQVDVGPRAMGSRILGAVKEGRATRRFFSTFRLTEGYNFSGVGASLVTNLPASAPRDFGGSLSSVIELGTRYVAIRALYVGETSHLAARKMALSLRRTESTERVLTCARGVLKRGRCVPCCVCHRDEVINGLRGIN